MRQQTQRALIISLVVLLLLSACSDKTSDWKRFSIEQEPALNIEFRLPPGWLLDYAPTRDKSGQWEITLVPPKCAPEQQIEYQKNCVTLIAHIKGIDTFNKESFFEVTGQDIPLSRDGDRAALFLGQESFRVNRIKIDRFNHLITSVQDEVQMSTYFFETDGAYFTFITNFPYDMEDNEAVDNFSLLLSSLKKTGDS
ncbi:MAG: hypothetical protein GX142_04240 [Chloroflexi bacterium]|jgi:hypothetical protein|nr:hypothetical protein [Chloroflexota bacterium]